jgi:acyl-CoA thioester hydrolase
VAPFEHHLRVRFHECDPQGVAFNATYLTWVDVALTELFRAVAGSYQALIDGGVDVVVAETTVRYRIAARPDDALVVALSLAGMGTTSMTTHADIVRAGATIATVDTRYVFVDPSTHGKRSPPDDLRARLQRFTAGRDSRAD